MGTLYNPLFAQADGAVPMPSFPVIPLDVILGAVFAALLMLFVTPKRNELRAAACAGIVGLALGGFCAGMLAIYFPRFAALPGAALAAAFGTGTLLTKAYLLALDQLPQVGVDVAKDSLRAGGAAIVARLTKTSIPPATQPPAEPGTENQS